MDNKLSNEDAIKVLIRAAQIAQSKGCFSLEEASTIHNACLTFISKEPSTNTAPTKKNEENRESGV